MLFINTRPTERAQPLSEAMQAAQFTVLELPLLKLTAYPFSDDLAQLYAQLSVTDVIVVVSPMAVEVGFAYLQRAGLCLDQLQHMTWIAVGQATATCLMRYGVSKISVPELETSEGMLSLPALQQLNVKKIAFWRGEGGRQFMMQQLAQQGISVLNFLLYYRECPTQSHMIFKQNIALIRQHEICYVCISSEASWLNWLNLCQNDQDILTRCHYLVLGTRLSDVLQITAKKMNCHLKQQILTDLSPQQIQQRIMYNHASWNSK